MAHSIACFALSVQASALWFHEGQPWAYGVGPLLCFFFFLVEGPLLCKRPVLVQRYLSLTYCQVFFFCFFDVAAPVFERWACGRK